MTDNSYAATISHICSESRGKISSKNPERTFDNPNLLLPAHVNKQTKKRQRKEDKENTYLQYQSQTPSSSDNFQEQQPHQFNSSQQHIHSYQHVQPQQPIYQPLYSELQNFQFILQQQQFSLLQQQEPVNRNSCITIRKIPPDQHNKKFVNDEDTCDGIPPGK